MRGSGWLIAVGCFSLGMVLGHAVAFTDYVNVLHQAEATYDPKSKFVPTPREIVPDLLKLGEVRAGDVVYDLGCGDGRLVIQAVKWDKNVRGVCVEIDHRLIERARQYAQAEGVADRIDFIEKDLYTVDLRNASVVMLFLIPEMNAKLLSTLKALTPGSRVVSHWHGIPGWEPDKTVQVTALGRTRPLYGWRVN